MALCERTHPSGTRRGLSSPTGHLRPLQQAPGQRGLGRRRFRPARHPHHSHRGQGGRHPGGGRRQVPRHEQEGDRGPGDRVHPLFQDPLPRPLRDHPVDVQDPSGQRIHLHKGRGRVLLSEVQEVQ